MKPPVLDRPTPTGEVQLAEEFQRIRRFTEQLCAPLELEDYVVQSMPDCSPTKWHLAHVSWFFETFLLKPHAPGYRSLHPDYAFLFNSYYNAVGERHTRAKRGLISRPTVKDTFAYRAYVDEHVLDLLELADDQLRATIAPIVVLGLNHEQQHQELLVTDLKHMLSENPLHPVYAVRDVPAATAPPLGWRTFAGGVSLVGHAGGGFAFDNESPRHREFVQTFALASRPVTNAEYLAFIADGGYARPELWLSAGWNTVQEQGWQAPLYWSREGGRWFNQTLSGYRPVYDPEPVTHVSFYEADAFARWSDARLPTEAEWEVAATDLPIVGNFVESGVLHPRPSLADPLAGMYGDNWEWTQSAYSPYPGFRPAEGAIGEYNGKFMVNQYVLRGGSCATAESHIRATYRNFFPADARWQFMGVRLARDV